MKNLLSVELVRPAGNCFQNILFGFQKFGAKASTQALRIGPA